MNGKTIGKIGVGSWTFPWATGTVLDHRPETPLDPLGVVQRAAELGVHVVHYLDNLPLDACGDDAVGRASDFAAEHGIEVEIGTRGTDPEHLLNYLKIAQRMGARLIRTMGGWHGAPAPLPQVESNLRKVLPAFDDAGVRIALENYEAYRTSDLGELVGRIGRPCLGICLDLTNSFGALESADEILRNLVPYAISVHLKEFAVERLEFLMGFAFRGKPTGQGMLPLRKMFDALAAASRQANVIVEQWPPFNQTLAQTMEMELDWARQSVEHLAAMGYLTK
ncbi:MAG: sugar phosphate isomerase/epimerase [Verrucomicrobia bacterium]|nr:sugar phosphate isomerase/epimerase [Verrucomicrobiota bacterium]